VHFYKIYWEWYDDCETYELVHERKFTQKEFEKMVNEAVKWAFEQLLSKCKEDFIGFCMWDEVAKLAIQYLKSRYGFKEVKCTAVHGYWGCYIIDSKCHRDELRQMEKVLGRDLLEKIIRHNDRVHEDILKRRRSFSYT